MRRLLTILTSDQRKLLTNETQTDSSKIDDSQLNESPKTTNTDDDTKLHVARYYKSETDWEELLTQVCSSPMKGKDKMFVLLYHNDSSSAPIFTRIFFSSSFTT
jgi:hypothetical protein